MDILFGTIGKIFSLFYENTGSYVIGVLMVALMAKLMLLFPAQRFYRNLTRRDFFQSIIDKAHRRHKKDAAAAHKAIVDELVRNKYQIWGFTGIYIGELILGILLGLSMKLAAGYFTAPDQLDIAWLGLHLARSPLEFWIEMQASGYFITALLLMIAVSLLQSLHSSLCSQHLVLDQGKTELVLLGAAVLLTVLLPEAFALYFLFLRGMDLLHYYVAVGRR